jgi:hypothetical protein
MAIGQIQTGYGASTAAQANHVKKRKTRLEKQLDQELAQLGRTTRAWEEAIKVKQRMLQKLKLYEKTMDRTCPIARAD